MQKNFIGLMLFVIGIVIGLIGGWLLQKENLVDACVDAGGRWEVNGSFCSGI